MLLFTTLTYPRGKYVTFYSFDSLSYCADSDYKNKIQINEEIMVYYY